MNVLPMVQVNPGGFAAPTVDLIYGMAVGNGEKLHIGPLNWADGRRRSSFCRRAFQSTYRPLLVVPVSFDARWCQRCTNAYRSLEVEIDTARSQTPYLTMARDAAAKALKAFRASLD